MVAPQIVIEDFKGRHNSSDFEERLKTARLYEDQSTICVIPTRGYIHAKVVQNWLGLMTPMNQKFTRMTMIGLEVGEAYEQAIDAILKHPDLSKWKFMLTLEEDNLVPPDGLLRLIKSIGNYDAVGGLYWTKGEGGQPMCYGSPTSVPVSFIPQIPKLGETTECNGLGMGFTLFKISSLKKLREKLGDKPLFKTVQQYDPSKGGEAMTQDLYHFKLGREQGFRYACDAGCLVGHYDAQNDITW